MKGPLSNRLEILRAEIASKQPSVDDWLSIFSFKGQLPWSDRKERLVEGDKDSEAIEDSQGSVEFYRKVLLLQSEIYKLASVRKNAKEVYSTGFLELIIQFMDMFERSLLGSDFSQKLIDRPFKRIQKSILNNPKKIPKISEMFPAKK